MADHLSGIIERLERSEEWRPVEGWPYEISNLGVVRNSATKRALTPAIKDGHVHPTNIWQIVVRKTWAKAQNNIGATA